MSEGRAKKTHRACSVVREGWARVHRPVALRRRCDVSYGRIWWKEIPMHTAQLRITRCLIACALVAALVLGPGARPVRASGGVVTDCSSDAQFSSLLASGGTITFNCGAGPHTILISSQKSINLNTTVDGGGTITLDGQNTYRLFDVGAVLTLRRIVLARASFNGDGGTIRNNANGTLILENSTIR